MQKKVSKVRNVFMMFTPDICPGIEAKGLKTLLRLPFARFQYRHLCLAELSDFLLALHQSVER